MVNVEDIELVAHGNEGINLWKTFLVCQSGPRVQEAEFNSS